MNDSNLPESVSEDQIIQYFGDKLREYQSKGKKRKYVRFILAALGSLPWVGGFFGASAGMWAESEQGKSNEMFQLWLEEHQLKIEELGKDLLKIIERIDDFADEVHERLVSPNYLILVRSAFRTWDRAETSEKREYVRKLLTNAVATTLCPDDLVRLFISWIEKYHEAHFMVIREIYNNPGISRGEIWDRIDGSDVRDDSAEADIFKMLIRDLSTGGVIRQEKRTNSHGQYLKNTRTRRSTNSKTMKSPFDRIEPYVLTKLGEQFVHYTMDELATRIGEGGA